MAHIARRGCNYGGIKNCSTWKRINRSISRSGAVQREARVRSPMISSPPPTAINVREGDAND